MSAVRRSLPGIVLAALASGVGATPPALTAKALFPNPAVAIGDDVQITIADFDEDNHPDLVVDNPDDETAPFGVFFLKGHGDFTFDPPRSLASGLFAGWALAHGDFDADGHQDLVLSSFSGTSVSLGDGHGQFGSPHPVPGAFKVVMAEDVDGDAVLDILGRTPSDQLSYLPGLGSGEFAAEVSLYDCPQMGAVAVDDINEDGLPDLTLICPSETTGLVVLYGVGGGRWVQGTSPAPGWSMYAQRLEDFDRDHHLDFVVCGAPQSGQSPRLFYLHGRGDGRFSDPAPIAGDRCGEVLEASDVSGDGFADLILSNDIGLRVHFGAADGTFSAPLFSPQISEARLLQVADVNSDTRPDLALLTSRGAHLLAGDGSGRFGHWPKRNEAGFTVHRLEVFDFDASGTQDLVAFGDTQTAGLVLTGDGHGGFTKSSVLPSAGTPAEDPFADFNDDGLPDIIIEHAPDGLGHLVLSDGLGGFHDSTPLGHCQPVAVLQGYLDHDRNEDLVFVGCGDPASITSLLGHGDGTFEGPTTTSPACPSDHARYLLKDFDGDQDDDLLMLSLASGVCIQFGAGDGTLGPSIHVPGRVPSLQPAIGDLGGDHRLDLVFPDDSDGTVKVLMGDAAAVFITRSYDVGTDPQAVVLDEFNGDAHPDLVTVIGNSLPVLRLLPGRADGTLGPTRSLRLNSWGAPIATDLDDDDARDLAQFRGQELVLLPNSGAGEFARQEEFLTPSFGQLLLRDMNDDGKDDVVGFREGSGEIYVALNGAPLANSSPRAVIRRIEKAECASPSGATVFLDASGSTDPDSSPGTNDDIIQFEWFLEFGQPNQALLGTGSTLSPTLSLGRHAITMRATDRSGLSHTSDAEADVVDTAPPRLAVLAEPSSLWPPSHELVPVRVAWQVLDACDPHPAIALKSVATSEPDDAPGPGDGSTTGDIAGAGIGLPDSALSLRAERDASGPGRIYRLAYRAVDASGNSAAALAIVAVPHDQGSGK